MIGTFVGWTLSTLSLLGGFDDVREPEATAELRQKVDELVAPLLEQAPEAGIVIGIVDGKTRHVFGYGPGPGGADRPPDQDTLYEIGSVTKVFTTLLLARMAEEGSVRLDDPVRTCLPEGTKVPTRDGREITLLDLATHTSGLPRLPSNLLLAGLFSSNPYSTYGAKDIETFLASYQLRRDIGAKYEYSNLGVGLLGHALTLKAGATDYEDLVVSAIGDPLGMPDTRMTLTPAQRERFIPGHDIWGKPTPAWDFQALAGAGALRSSARDMMTFLEANLGLRESPLLAAMRTCHEGRHDTDLEGVRVALGWHLSPLAKTGATACWHNGGTGGYHSFLGFVETDRVGVIVLTNSARLGPATDRAGFQILELLHTQVRPAPTETK